MNCACCGSENPENAVFCQNCGGKVETVPSAAQNVALTPPPTATQPVNNAALKQSGNEQSKPAPARYKCINPDCLTVYNSYETKFCAKCGAPLADTQRTSSNAKNAYAPPPMQQTQPQPFQPQYGATPMTPGQAQYGPGTGGSGRGSQNKAIIAVLVGAAALIVVVLMVYLLSPGSPRVERMPSLPDYPALDTISPGLPTQPNTLPPSATTPPQATSSIPPQPPTEDVTLQMEIVQVDSASFPQVSLYMAITGWSGDAVENLNKEQFEVLETDDDGGIVATSIVGMRKVPLSEQISVNLVIDKSGGMGDDNKMSKAQNAATAFLSLVNSTGSGDLVEITIFDDYVYVPQSFTDDYHALYDSIQNISPDGGTALYDALYSALLTTNAQRGAKCVIAFANGTENASSYTFDDVAHLAQSTGIPLYLVGVGDDCDNDALAALAEMTNGMHYVVQPDNLDEALTWIYSYVYTKQRGLYLVEYRSGNTESPDEFRSLRIAAKDGAGYIGEAEREYVPIPTINDSFSDQYKNKDFIFPNSATVALTQGDLEGLSLAELRIARNEIYARHGRQFRDPFLNKWFYSKQWYLSIMKKYSPGDFDRMPTPMNRTEGSNITFIRQYENYMMENERIFPQSSTVLLTEYDVMLSKSVLRKALEQIYSYAGVANGDKSRLNSVEIKNVELIEYALSQEQISY